jgi:hypothetical protein
MLLPLAAQLLRLLLHTLLAPAMLLLPLLLLRLKSE